MREPKWPWLLLFLLALLTILFIIDNADRIDRSDLPDVEHQVRQGETLWDIAAEYKPEGVHMQEYIYWLREQNGGSALVQRGQVLSVPDGRDFR